MTDVMEQSSQLETKTLGIFRTAATAKGGRRFSFGALVVAGDHNGKVGFGYAKSNEVPVAIEKAEKQAKRSLISIPMSGKTLPHEVQGRFNASQVRILPASPGTGVVAGATVRTVLELAGFTDCLSKSFGSTNAMNVVKAVFDGLSQLRTPELISQLRGQDLGPTTIEQKIEAGQRFMPSSGEGERMQAPVNTIGQERRGELGRLGGPRGRGGRGGGWPGGCG
ncbi:MAG: 30S ribosomal protein S5 [Salinibacterium sp.]|nr:30S ribosomal protein S5 [Salinibacterium sp.]